MANALKNVLSNPREAKFVYKMQRLSAKSQKRRKEVFESDGIEVPPFLISSISTSCNLHCKGCYARSNGIASDSGEPGRESLSPEQWKKIFTEAAEMGINFSLLAGGEPMMRKDIIEAVAQVEEMIFPVFTNGTLITHAYLDFLSAHQNIVPVISIEGTALGTDERRGQGALKSPLFRKIRAAKALGWEHTGGCTLFEHRDEVQALLASE
ncbi:MAG: radical SAM protein [Bacteroidales bacterium]|nr:radical SAM protein [Bacteroidales bacterium]MBR0030649.1 radical SAM protein [Bacteroidales bacterium]